jgi:hypothetical protein
VAAWRQDDHGNEFLVGEFPDCGSAERARDEFIARGHHQHYCARDRRVFPLREGELDARDVTAQVGAAPEDGGFFKMGDVSLGYAQDQELLVDVRILEEDVAPDAAVFAGGRWFLLCREPGAGPVEENVNRLTDLFPGLVEPLRAGEGMWEREDERYTRIDPDAELVAELEAVAQALKR